MLPTGATRSCWKEPIDLTGASVTLKLRNTHPRSDSSSDVLSGSTAGGEITFPTIGYINWQFDADRFSSLCAGTYRAGIIIERDGETVQLFLGTVTIEEGF